MEVDSREIQIEQIVLAAVYEASTDSFFGIKAARVLLLRSEIDRKAKELSDTNPELKEKLEIVSKQLLEAERVLGELVSEDPKPIDYVPLTKNKK